MATAEAAYPLGMYLIVVGGGSLGQSLIEIAVDRRHDVTVIEADEKIAESLAERFDVRVLHAGIGDGGILEEAEAARADALAATTADDSANLMAMVLGLEAGIATLVSVVNDRHHRSLFLRLGVHVLVDPDVILAQHLWGMIARPELEESVALPSGGLAFEVTLIEKSELAGLTLGEARERRLFDPNVVIVWLRREGKAELPEAETRFEVGDELTVFSPEPISEKQLKVFRGGE